MPSTSSTRRRWIPALAGALVLVAVVVAISRPRRTSLGGPNILSLFLHVPRPLLSRERVLRMLAPAPGQRVLEIGPGPGYYTLDLATALAPNGSLDLLDIEASMLQTVMQRAGERRIGNISSHVGDAQACPFPDATFDAILTAATLGEIPDQAQALREMRRVLKPTGHLIIAEGQPDPHIVTRKALATLAEGEGFTIADWEGNALGYVARLEPLSASYTATVTSP